MKLNPKSLEKLRELINEEIEYRSGPKLVSFFNDLGFNEEYKQGFPSRWYYTDEKLNSINGTKKIEECIQKLFAPINFIESPLDLYHHIENFNKFLDFDGYTIRQKDKKIFINSVNIESPLSTSITFDETHIHSQWEKAIERKSSDPEGAITIARTLIESLLKHILYEQNITHNENMELSELYKEVAKLLNLAPEQHQEQIFKQILGGANGIISGLGAMRNKLGDAHGATKSKIKPQERHSELAVNLAGSITIFLFKTYKEHLAIQNIKEVVNE